MASHISDVHECHSGFHRVQRLSASAVSLAIVAVARSSRVTISGVHIMSLGAILLIILVLMLIGVLPTWPHSANWGYYPSGGLGVILIVVVVLLVLGRI
jgi:hypothetical protein